MLVYITRCGSLKPWRRTHELMLAFYHRKVPGHSENDSGLKSWPAQVIDNPVQIKTELEKTLS